MLHFYTPWKYQKTDDRCHVFMGHRNLKTDDFASTFKSVMDRFQGLTGFYIGKLILKSVFSNPFLDQSSDHIETSQLIYSVN